MVHPRESRSRVVFKLSMDKPGFSPIIRKVYNACQTRCHEGRKVVFYPHPSVSNYGAPDPAAELFQSFIFIWLHLEVCIVMLEFSKPYTVGQQDGSSGKDACYRLL